MNMREGQAAQHMLIACGAVAGCDGPFSRQSGLVSVGGRWLAMPLTSDG